MTMTQKKSITAKLKFTIQGSDEFDQALSDVIEKFQAFQDAAKALQTSVDYLNTIEIKVVNE